MGAIRRTVFTHIRWREAESIAEYRELVDLAWQHERGAQVTSTR